MVGWTSRQLAGNYHHGVLATFCDMWSSKQPELMPFGHINCFELEIPTTPRLPTTPIGELVVLAIL